MKLKKLEQEIAKSRPHELKTATKLAKHGVTPAFVEDSIQLENGIRIGLSDCRGGIEIKTLSTASSINTVKVHYKRAKNKKDIAKCYFDNSENLGLDDSVLIDFFNTRKNNNFSIYLLTRKNELLKIKEPQ